jgi:hypothetical protein
MNTAVNPTPAVVTNAFPVRRLPLPIVAFGSLCLSAGASSLVVLKFAAAPFFWVWLILAFSCFIAMSLVHRDWTRAVLLSFGFAACLLSFVEARLIELEYVPPTYVNGRFIVPDAVLGWAPAKDFRAHAIKPGPAGLFHGPRGVLFDRIYTIDSDGLRIAPPYVKGDASTAMVFFGCSFAFGEGLADDETLPYQVGVQSGGLDRTYNFGFEAYGAEQMLAAIEHGMVTKIVQTSPKYAFYVAIPGHVWRAAGKVAWGGHAPRYVLDSDGNVLQQGYLADRPSLDDRLGLDYRSRLKGQMDKWALWRTFSSAPIKITDDDIRLYFAVVRRSHQLLAEEYPGIKFQVILWPNQGNADRYAYEKMQSGFGELGIPYVRVDDILPGFQTNRSLYILSSYDHHPNALADHLLAAWIVQNTRQSDSR